MAFSLCGSDALKKPQFRGWKVLRRNVKRFRGGLVFKAHGLAYHSTLGWRVIKKKEVGKYRRGSELLEHLANVIIVMIRWTGLAPWEFERNSVGWVKRAGRGHLQ